MLREVFKLSLAVLVATNIIRRLAASPVTVGRLDEYLAADWAGQTSDLNVGSQFQHDIFNFIQVLSILLT